MNSSKQNIKLKKNALFIFEVGEEFLWIDMAKEVIEKLLVAPFSVKVTAVNNQEFKETDVFKNDIIFLANLLMPNPDGFEILSRLQNINVRIPIVVSSAYSDNLFFDRLTSHGIKFSGQVKFLSKPFLFEELLNVFFELLYFEPAREGASNIELIKIQPINTELITHLAKHSEELFKVSSRFFEELIAELLYREGWRVELTPIGADGGIDIIAIRSEFNLSQMMLVQVKRYAEHRKVGISTVRELLHVIDDKKATHGMLVTSSSFSKNAIEKQLSNKWRLSLKNHQDIINWLNKLKAK